MLLQKIAWCIGLFVALYIFNTVLAQKPEPAEDYQPLTAQLEIERTSFTTDESSQAVLILTNTSPYTLSNVATQSVATDLIADPDISFPSSIAPYESIAHNYTLQSKAEGSYNAVFTIAYTWNDQATGIVHQQIAIASSDNIKITPSLAFDLPEYLSSRSLLVRCSVWQAW